MSAWKVRVVGILNVELEKLYSSLEILVRDHSNLLFFVKTLYQLDVATLPCSECRKPSTCS